MMELLSDKHHDEVIQNQFSQSPFFSLLAYSFFKILIVVSQTQMCTSLIFLWFNLEVKSIEMYSHASADEAQKKRVLRKWRLSPRYPISFPVTI